MSYATNEDLTDYMPDALEHGVADWSAELALAESDVQRDIKVRWFIPEFGTGKNFRGSVSLEQYDITKLTATQWTRATVYRAMYQYILPKLSTFRPEGDSFRERIDFYRSSYAEEMNAQLSSGVEYDFDNDGTVESGEVWATQQNRLYR
jgi:hypothetical protein